MTKETMLKFAKATVSNKRLSRAAKQVSMAQAMVAIGDGYSELFAHFNNPYALRYYNRIATMAYPVEYQTRAGVECFASFESYDAAVACYEFHIATGRYPAPVDASPEAYLEALIKGGYAPDRKYRAKVLAMLPGAESLLVKAKEISNVVSAALLRSRRGVPLFRLGVVVGHNATDRGADSVPPLAQDEYAFNTEVAEIMEALGPEYRIDVQVLFRPGNMPYSAEIDEVYATADALKVDATMELHFNAASPALRGTEVLSSESAKSIALAAHVQEELVGLFGRSAETDRGVKPSRSGDRGYRSLAAGRAPAILIEPFYGSNAEDANLMAEIGKAALAEAYMKAASAYAVSLLVQAA